MELREYWGILARRWPLIAAITGLSLVASALMVFLGPSYYKSEIRIVVSLKPEPRQGNYYMYDRYYTWLTSEYLVDDLGEVIKSDNFAREVSQRLNVTEITKEAISRNITTKKTHRILTVTVITRNPHISYLIASGIKEILEQRASYYFAELNTDEAMLRVLDDPAAEAEMGLLRRSLEVGLRTAVGFLAALAVVFLLHYLDPTVRSAAEAERVLGMPVLAELPTK